MKFSSVLFTAFAAVLVSAHEGHTDASVSCATHGTHVECGSHESTTGTMHDHSMTEGAGPSPTESTGCVPHGNHWDCDGPAMTSGATAPAAVTSSATSDGDDHEGDEHEEGDHEETDHEAGTGSAGPSPTESVGCVPHGNHWDCEGPAVTSTNTADGVSAPTTTDSDAPVQTDAAMNAFRVGWGAIGAGLVAVAAGFVL